MEEGEPSASGRLSSRPLDGSGRLHASPRARGAMVRDLRPQVTTTAWVAFTILWIVATAASFRFLSYGLVQAVLAGLMLAALHWAALFVHHFGHALAARSSGHPMVGVRLRWWLGTSLYPRDEVVLPAATHIRRALGGPLASIGFALVASGLALALRSQGNALWIGSAFVALDSLFVFGVGSVIPLGFNDGSTLIRWSTKRG